MMPLCFAATQNGVDASTTKAGDIVSTKIKVDDTKNQVFDYYLTSQTASGNRAHMGTNGDYYVMDIGNNIPSSFSFIFSIFIFHTSHLSFLPSFLPSLITIKHNTSLYPAKSIIVEPSQP